MSKVVKGKQVSISVISMIKDGKKGKTMEEGVRKAMRIVGRASCGKFHFTPFYPLFSNFFCKNSKFYRFLEIKQSTPLCFQKYRILKKVGIPTNFRYTDFAGSPANRPWK